MICELNVFLRFLNSHKELTLDFIDTKAAPNNLGAAFVSIKDYSQFSINYLHNNSKLYK